MVLNLNNKQVRFARRRKNHYKIADGPPGGPHAGYTTLYCGWLVAGGGKLGENIRKPYHFLAHSGIPSVGRPYSEYFLKNAQHIPSHF